MKKYLIFCLTLIQIFIFCSIAGANKQINYYPYAVASDHGTTASRTVKAYNDAIGSSKEATIVFEHSGTGNNTSYTFLTDEVIGDPNTDNIKLKFEKGARLALTHCSVTINGPIEAGLYQIFDVDANSSVLIGDDSVERLNPIWFGATEGSDVSAAVRTANVLAFKKMLDCGINSDVSAYFIPAGTYEINDEITTAIDEEAQIIIEGAQKTRTIIYQVDPNEYNLYFVRSGGGTTKFELRNLSLRGGSYGLYSDSSHGDWGSHKKIRQCYSFASAFQGRDLKIKPQS